MCIIKPSKKEMEILEQIIRNVIAEKVTRQNKLELLMIAKSLKEKGAEGIILGCTELPLIFPKRFNIPVFDSLNILAERLLKCHYEKRKKKASYFEGKLLN
ncbi:MAG: aspartate/glutamate racemase family protein [Candidatus Daviesbacteria bacterium]|nr:aspartate/glutamate racemase family protein [Candidatus Daviesbacteria bacterium]